MLTAKTFISEFCSNERFGPSCNHDEVIVMTHALYGRMKVGKCIERGMTGCKTDVLGVLDKECSNKRSCDILVVDLGFHDDIEDPCSDLRSYLEASYMCQKGKSAFTFKL